MFGADSVPATGGLLPRLQVGASIGTIRADSIVPTSPIFQFTDLLTARLPGVVVQSNGGLSGSGAQVVIRGIGSLAAGTDPVVYLDGVRIAAEPNRAQGVNQTLLDDQGPLQMGRLEDLSPNEIERVDVLSGPQATTQYGLDAWNGVILVTTRRAAAGGPHWSAYAEDGVLTPPPPRVADSYMPWGHPTSGTTGESYCSLFDQSAGACVIDSVTHFSPLSDGTTSPLTNGSRDHFGLQASGAAGPGRYFLSGDRQSEMGILAMPRGEEPSFDSLFGHTPLAGQQRPNSLDRTNLRATLGADLGEHADLAIFGNAMDGVHRTTDDQGLAQDAAITSGSRNVEDGWGSFERPSITFSKEAADRVERYVYGASANLRPASFVTLHFTAGADQSDTHSENLTRNFPPCLVFCGNYEETTEHVTTDQYTGDAGVSASLPIRDGWTLQSDLGLQYREQHQVDDAISGSIAPGQTFPAAAQDFLTLNPDGIQRGAYVEETVAWAGKVTVTGAVHGEGPHGLLGKGTQGFPRLAASWIPFERGGDVVRVHAAFGITGDLAVTQQAPAAFERNEFFTGSPFLIPHGPGVEYTHEGEAGIDASTAQGRLSAGATVYQRTTDDMAMPYEFANQFGILEAGFSNTGSVQDRGIEFTIGAAAVSTAAIRWDANLSAWGNQNRLEAISQFPAFPFGGVYAIQRGQPLYAISEPNLTFHDTNGDGVIEPNEVTMSAATVQGSSVPTRGASLHNSLTLLGGRFQIGALVDYEGGNKLIDPVLNLQLGSGLTRGSADPKAPLVEQAEAIARTVLGGDYFGPAQDASFVRFRELSFTVHASQGIARALRTSSAAISLVARNLWLWTPYRGTDPEINTDAGSQPSIPETVVPEPRYFVARVTLGY